MGKRGFGRSVLILAMASLVGCAGEETVMNDAGPRNDASAIDAANEDATTPRDGGSDAEAIDATVLPDSSLSDSGSDATMSDDASTPTDAGSDSGGVSFPIASACPAYAGGSSNGECVFPASSTDGRYIAFSSDATDLLATTLVNPVGSSDLHRVFVRDTMSNTTEVVGHNIGGTHAGTPYAPLAPSISGDGRYVTYALPANQWDSVSYSSPNPTVLLLRDRDTDTSTVINKRFSGSFYDASGVQLSGNGRYVALRSTYTLTSSTHMPSTDQIYVRDLSGDGDAIEMASVGFDNMPAAGFSYAFGDLSISDDGNRVAFTTNADNFLTGAVSAGVPGWMKHCFVRDLTTDTTTRVDVASTGSTGDWPNGECAWVVIAGNGRYVAFATDAPNVVAGDTNGYSDIFVRDLMLNTTERITLSDSGAEITDSAPTASASIVREIDISDDGNYLVFLSFSHSLVAGDTATDAGRQGFLRDRAGAHTYRFTLHPDGSEFTDLQAAFIPRISGDGSSIVFTGNHAGIVPGSSGSYELFTVPRSAL